MADKDAPAKKYPVIVLTGTPGTGKTTHAQMLVSESPVPLQHINVSEWVKDKSLHQGFNEEWQSYEVDDDKVLHACLIEEPLLMCALSSSTNWNPWLLRVV